jgi:hypothetical protein
MRRGIRGFSEPTLIWRKSSKLRGSICRLTHGDLTDFLGYSVEVGLVAVEAGQGLPRPSPLDGRQSMQEGRNSCAMTSNRSRPAPHHAPHNVSEPAPMLKTLPREKS